MPEVQVVSVDQAVLFRVVEVEGGHLVLPGDFGLPSFGACEADSEVGYLISSAGTTSVPLPLNWRESFS